MKRIISILLLLGMVLTISALDNRQTKINTIKKSKEYLYSDITSSTNEAAISQAFEQIQQEILIWATDRAEKTIDHYPSPVEINELIDTIMVRRAEMYRVFAYVKKVKLIPLFNEWNLVLLDQLDADEQIDEVEGNDGGNESTANQPQPQEKSEGQPKQKHSKDSVVSEKVRNLLKNNFLGKKGGVIEKIKKAKNFFELKQIMEPLKEKGDILDYGKYATATKPEDCYLIVYDPAGNIRALLGKGKKVRHNLKTGKDDSIKNYRGCGAIWFTIKEK